MSLSLDKSTWKRVTFGDVALASKEKVDPASGDVERYIAGEHMDTDDLKIHRWGEVGDGYLGPAFHRRFHPSQVLYGSRRTYLRKVAVADFSGVTANTTFVIETKDSDRLLQEFLPFVMTSEPFHAFAIQESKGSVNPYVNWSDIARYEFDLPPVDEQKRLADLLWAVERHRKTVAVTTNSNTLAANAYFSSTLADHRAESVPAPALIEEMTVGVVVQPTQYYTDDMESGVPALRGLNVLPGGFDLTDLVYFRPESARELRKSTLRAGDVVVIRTGRPGDAAAVTRQMDGYNCIDLIILRPGPRIEPRFVARFLNSDFGRSQIMRHSAGTAQQHFNVGALKKLLIPALPLGDQRTLVETAERIQAASNRSDHEHQSLARLRAALLSDIFGGAT